MPRNPWTDLDPQPGDFDADLIAVDPRYVEAHPANPDAKLTLVGDIHHGASDPPRAPHPRRQGR
jgi:hypothetical protein